MTKPSELVRIAVGMIARAYAPYSRYQVGAALLAADGRVFTGCNVENASFGLSMCAERVAVGAAVAAGAKSFSAIAVAVVGKSPASPCGACRQVLAEFGPGLRVLLANEDGRYRATTLRTLLPGAFGRGGLAAGRVRRGTRP